MSYDIGSRPGQDERYFPYRNISLHSSDFSFVMSYDERSQIYGPCVAWANSAINNTISGEFSPSVIIVQEPGT